MTREEKKIARQKKMKKGLIIGSLVLASVIGATFMYINYRIKNKK